MFYFIWSAAAAVCSTLNFDGYIVSCVVSQAFNYVEKFGASGVPTLPAAVTLCRLLTCLASKTDLDHLRRRTCENFIT